MKHTVEEVRLKNGARGLLIDVPGATVMSFQIQFRAGNRYVKSGHIYETAHIMEHMAFGANDMFKNEHEFESEFTKNGAYHNAYTSDLSMVYIATCADFEWDRIFDLQQVSICKPRFNNVELEAEKGNVKSELTGYLNDHNRVLWPKVQQLLGEDVLTYNQRLRTISNVRLQHVKEHHARTHTAANMRFVIAGKLNGRKSEIKRQLEEWDLPAGERFEAPKDDMYSGTPTLIRRKEASNLTFAWSMIMPRLLTDTEAEAMGALDHLLTGTMTSRIYGKARKKGLAYGMFSDTTVNSHDSSWDFGGQVNLDTSGALVDIIVRELKAVLKGDVTEQEIDAAKSYMLGRYQMGAQTVSQISSFYTGRYFSDDVVRNYDDLPNRIRGISRDCMIDTAREFVRHNTNVFAGVSSGERKELVELNNKLATLFEQN